MKVGFLQLVERGGQRGGVLLQLGHRLDRVGLAREIARDLLELEHDLLALLLDLLRVRVRARARVTARVRVRVRVRARVLVRV